MTLVDRSLPGGGRGGGGGGGGGGGNFTVQAATVLYSGLPGSQQRKGSLKDFLRIMLAANTV